MPSNHATYRAFVPRSRIFAKKPVPAPVPGSVAQAAVQPSNTTQPDAAKQVPVQVAPTAVPARLKRTSKPKTSQHRSQCPVASPVANIYIDPVHHKKDEITRRDLNRQGGHSIDKEKYERHRWEKEMAKAFKLGEHTKAVFDRKGNKIFNDPCSSMLAKRVTGEERTPYEKELYDQQFGWRD